MAESDTTPAAATCHGPLPVVTASRMFSRSVSALSPHRRCLWALVRFTAAATNSSATINDSGLGCIPNRGFKPSAVGLPGRCRSSRLRNQAFSNRRARMRSSSRLGSHV